MLRKKTLNHISEHHPPNLSRVQKINMGQRKKLENHEQTKDELE